MNTISNILTNTDKPFSIWTKLFLKTLSEVQKGSIVIETPEGYRFNYCGMEEGENVLIKVYDWSFAEELFMKGDIGLGESYIAGFWDCDEINKLIRFGIENKHILEKVIRGSLLKIIFYRAKHMLNRNSKQGSKKNIHAHYDLGNEFYKLWLDPTMTYSSGLFITPETELQAAQKNKYENILNQLRLKDGDHILEVGCGWGGFMEYAAERGVRVTGITISREQYLYAEERLKKYPNLATVKLMDYRDISDQYNHVVSIEMFEALGEDYWKNYFKILHSALKMNGNLIIQSITINDQDFSSYRKGTDFIQQYIFPGGMLPSPSIFKNLALKEGFTLDGELEFGKHYALTLKKWEEDFQTTIEPVKLLGFDQKFIRTWKFYLKYCQGGFEAEKLSVFQFYLTKEERGF
jgi:cyclopropane-fatty-acyl-phospholipid synthase